MFFMTHQGGTITSRRAHRRNRNWSIFRQFVAFCSILFGVIFSRSLDELRVSGNVTLISPASRLVAYFIVALMITPFAYQRKMERLPPIVEFGILIQYGVFWQILLSALSRTL